MAGYKSKGNRVRKPVRSVSQLGLFVSPIGEFVKEACFICLSGNHKAVQDLNFLKETSLEMDLYLQSGVWRKHAFTKQDDLSALYDCIETTELIIEEFDFQRTKKMNHIPSKTNLCRKDLDALFEFRDACRRFVLALLQE